MLNPKKDNLAYGFLKPEYPFKFNRAMVYPTIFRIRIAIIAVENICTNYFYGVSLSHYGGYQIFV